MGGLAALGTGYSMAVLSLACTFIRDNITPMRPPQQVTVFISLHNRTSTSQHSTEHILNQKRCWNEAQNQGISRQGDSTMLLLCSSDSFQRGRHYLRLLVCWLTKSRARYCLIGVRAK